MEKTALYAAVRGAALAAALAVCAPAVAQEAPPGQGTTPASQARPRAAFEIAPWAGAMSGDSTYKIGGDVRFPDRRGVVQEGELWFPISELKFPLDVGMAGLRARFSLSPGYGLLVLDGEYARNITREAGTMEDSDWTEWQSPGFKTIYSESDADLSAQTEEVTLTWRFLERRQGAVRPSLGAGVGYLREHFDYDISDARQWSVFPELNGSFRGKVLAYEVTYEIPYLELSGGLEFGRRGTVQGRLAVSPWTRVRDEDDHLLRKKRAEGDCTGEAVILGLRGTFFIVPGRLFTTLGLTALAVHTEGTQTQTRYADTREGKAGWIGDIDEEITSSQTRLDLGVGLSF